MQFYSCVLLSCCNHKNPTLEIKGAIPNKYERVIITDLFDNVLTHAGFDDGMPYFSDEFYQGLRTEYEKIITYDKERARNLFWFTVQFVNCNI